MNLKISLIPALALMILNPIVGNLKAPVIKTPPINDTDDVSKIAAKYESPTIDVSTINYDNYWSDIQKSSISKAINSGVTTNFEIDEINTAENYVWYDGDHGDTMRKEYNDKIESDSVTILDYLPVLSVMSKVAHYYGDNATMNPALRQAAIAKDVSVLGEMVNMMESKDLSYLNLGIGIFGEMKDWANKTYDLCNDILNKDYDKCPLLSELNNIDYDSLTSSYNNLHAAEDYLSTYDNSTAQGWTDIDDYFRVDNKDGHYIKITFNSSVDFTIEDFIVVQIWEFTFSAPENFRIELI